MKKTGLSKTLKLHFLRLLVRGSLFAAAIAVYAANSGSSLFERFGGFPHILVLVWLLFIPEMVLRMFPSRVESMGCGRQFRKNLRPYTGSIRPLPLPPELAGPRAGLVRSLRTAAAAGSWFALNGIILLLYRRGILDEGALLLVSLFYSVCDIICILFVCPFQLWFLKNRCCTTCRIYNWDFPMMFTPMFFIDHWYPRVLALVSLAVLLQWEVKQKLYPERFFEETNASLACRNCEERLCRFKRHIRPGVYDRTGRP